MTGNRNEKLSQLMTEYKSIEATNKKKMQIHQESRILPKLPRRLCKESLCFPPQNTESNNFRGNQPQNHRKPGKTDFPNRQDQSGSENPPLPNHRTDERLPG
jgi:hypothetical protein